MDARSLRGVAGAVRAAHHRPDRDLADPARPHRVVAARRDAEPSRGGCAAIAAARARLRGGGRAARRAGQHARGMSRAPARVPRAADRTRRARARAPRQQLDAAPPAARLGAAREPARGSDRGHRPAGAQLVPRPRIEPGAARPVAAHPLGPARGDRVKRSCAASVGALFVIALTLSILLRGDPLEYSSTSYGVLPEGYGALHDLLLELDVPVERSFASPRRLAPETTVWWIEPVDVCALLGQTRERDGRAAPANGKGADLETWIRRGGTAGLLSTSLGACKEELRFADLAFPPIDLHDPSTEPGRPKDRGGAARRLLRRDAKKQLVTGPLVPVARELTVVAPATFASVPDGFAVVASLDGAPVALEAAVGAGRLVRCADSIFLRNEFLDRSDSAPFAFDWVRAYGVPRLDEWEHGLSETPSTVAYLAESPALPVFAGLAASGMLFGWAGASTPRRRIGGDRPAPPALGTYVASLARLYARAGDAAAVSERYRAYGWGDLRRALSPAHDAPPDRIGDVLRSRTRATEADLAVLCESVAVRGRAELDAACDAIDRLIAVAR